MKAVVIFDLKKSFFTKKRYSSVMLFHISNKYITSAIFHDETVAFTE